MKSKDFSKKPVLKKTTIADLGDVNMSEAKGGTDRADWTTVAGSEVLCCKSVCNSFCICS